MFFSFRTSLLTLGLLGGSISLAAPGGTNDPAGVIYTLNNNPQNTSILAVAVSKYGTLYGSPVSTKTGGKGGSGVTGKGQPNVGSLFSANSIVSSENYLFTVNAGSNTVSMFMIEPNDPLRPMLVGKPVDTLGEFPVSLAYSSSLSMLCVLNGGAMGGVTCFDVDPSTGLSTSDTAPRSIAQGLNQTTPPVGPFSTASDIQFNPSSSALVVSIKGSPLTVPVSPGFLFAWPVVNGKVAKNATVNKVDSLILDFSLSFTGSDFDLLITDPALGADLLSVSSTLEISVQKPINITYQKAACWSYYDAASQAFFVSDAAQSNVTMINAIDGSIKQTINFDASLAGGQDMVMAGNSLYLLSSQGPLVTIDMINNGQTAAQVQTFDPLPASMLKRDEIVGIAAWMSK